MLVTALTMVQSLYHFIAIIEAKYIINFRKISDRDQEKEED